MIAFSSRQKTAKRGGAHRDTNVDGVPFVKLFCSRVCSMSLIEERNSF